MLIARDVSDTSRLLAVRQDFIANVSHELRSPLTVLIGYIESIRTDELDRTTLMAVVQRLDAPAQRMKSLVEDLLTLTRLESSPLPELSSLSEIDGQSLISTIVEEAQVFVTPKTSYFRRCVAWCPNPRRPHRVTQCISQFDHECIALQPRRR